MERREDQAGERGSGGEVGDLYIIGRHHATNRWGLVIKWSLLVYLLQGTLFVTAITRSTNKDISPTLSK